MNDGMRPVLAEVRIIRAVDKIATAAPRPPPRESRERGV